MLVKEKIKADIRKALESGIKLDEDSADPFDTVAGILADAVIDAIKNMELTYTTGLIAPSMGGPVTGVLQYTIL